MYYNGGNRYTMAKPKPSDKDFLNKMPIFVPIIIMAILQGIITFLLSSDIMEALSMFSSVKYNVFMVIISGIFSIGIGVGLTYLVGYVFYGWFRSLTYGKVDIYYKYFISIYFWFAIITNIMDILTQVLLMYIPQTFYMAAFVLQPLSKLILLFGMIWYINRTYVTDGYYTSLVIRGISIPVLTMIIVSFLLGII